MFENKAKKVMVSPAEPSVVVMDSMEAIKFKLLNKVLSKGDVVDKIKVHEITPEKAKVTEKTEIVFKSEIKG